jgi:hypothetical protein
MKERKMFNQRTLFVPTVLVLVGLLSVLAAKAQNTPPDPAIRTGGGHGSVAITSADFVIVSPSGDSPATSDCVVIQHGLSTTAPGCFFVNKIMTDDGNGGTIKGVIFIAGKASFSGALSCALDTALGGVSPWFSKCTVANRLPVVTFSGGSGIPYGGDFSFGFRQFNTNATFLVVAAGVF